jgi:hypothetical protein
MRDAATRLLDAAAADRRARACAATAAVRVGVLVNARAARGRAGRLGRLAELLEAPTRLRVTADLGALREAVAGLLIDDAVNVLGLVGGDGSVHHAVNALLALERASAAALGRATPLPRLLLLGGGTMNIVARALGARGAPEPALRQVAAAFRGAPLAALPARRLTTLRVRSASAPPRDGFVFGSEVLYHAIALYTRMGAGYGGLARFVWQLTRGATIGSALWRQEAWRLGPFPGALGVDAETFEDWTAAVATTVDLALARGAVRAIARPEHAEGFHVKIIQERDPRALVRLLPALLAERRVAGVEDRPAARSLTLAGPYTLDGELVDSPVGGPGRDPLRIEPGARLFALPGDLGARRF